MQRSVNKPGSSRLSDHQRRDHITLVAGDGDYEPVVKQLVADSFAVAVLYWAHASRELREAATTFHSLDRYVTDPALV